MKFLALMLLYSCASHRVPSDPSGLPIAQDSISKGKIRAEALKSIQDQDVCFEISLTLRGTPIESAFPNNWTLAWVDQKNQYRLLSLNQRDPASIPKKAGSQRPEYGASNSWKNTFRTCVAKEQIENVKALVLTPKELPFDHQRGLRLEWSKE